MQGRKQYERRLFSMVNLDEMIPENHLLVRLDRAISLDFIYDLTSELYCSRNGRPSIDPVLFFRMQLVGYLYGIGSDRKLCEEIHLNLAYRWFSHGGFREAILGPLLSTWDRESIAATMNLMRTSPPMVLPCISVHLGPAVSACWISG